MTVYHSLAQRQTAKSTTAEAANSSCHKSSDQAQGSKGRVSSCWATGSSSKNT